MDRSGSPHEPGPRQSYSWAAARRVRVIVVDDHRKAGPLAEVLSTAGLRCVEMALRTDAALPALRASPATPGSWSGRGRCSPPKGRTLRRFGGALRCLARIRPRGRRELPSLPDPAGHGDRE